MATPTNRADRAEEFAQERVLADADTFADWFYGECGISEEQPHQLPAQPRGEHTAEDFAETPVAELYRLAIDAGQKGPIRLAAMDAIRERYLKAKDAYIGRLSLESLEAA
jgi:hypothetical protein